MSSQSSSLLKHRASDNSLIKMYEKQRDDEPKNENVLKRSNLTDRRGISNLSSKTCDNILNPTTSSKNTKRQQYNISSQEEHLACNGTEYSGITPKSLTQDKHTLRLQNKNSQIQKDDDNIFLTESFCQRPSSKESTRKIVSDIGIAT